MCGGWNCCRHWAARLSCRCTHSSCTMAALPSHTNVRRVASVLLTRRICHNTYAFTLEWSHTFVRYESTSCVSLFQVTLGVLKQEFLADLCRRFLEIVYSACCPCNNIVSSNFIISCKEPLWIDLYANRAGTPINKYFLTLVNQQCAHQWQMIQTTVTE